MQTQAGRSMSRGQGEEREWIRVHTVGPLDATLAGGCGHVMLSRKRPGAAGGPGRVSEVRS